jgi:hypothetical protein
MQTFAPWKSHPSLQLERLKKVGVTIKTARDGVVPLHEPEAGDNRWSMHCRGYARQCHAIRALASTVDWLTVSSKGQDELELSFCIGNVPLKIVRGDPEEPAYRHRDFSRSEQTLMHTIMAQLPPGPLRLVAVTDARGVVESVFLVELDGQTPARYFQIPIDGAKGFEVAPPDVVPPPRIQSHDESSKQDSASA